MHFKIMQSKIMQSKIIIVAAGVSFAVSERQCTQAMPAGSVASASSQCHISRWPPSRLWCRL